MAEPPEGDAPSPAASPAATLPDRPYVRCETCQRTYPSCIYSPASGATVKATGNLEDCPFCGRINAVPDSVAAGGQLVQLSAQPQAQFVAQDKEFRFVHSCDFDHSFRNVNLASFPEAIRPVFSSFQRNMEVVRAMQTFPSLLMGLARRMQVLDCKAKVTVSGNMEATTTDPAIVYRTETELNRLFNEYLGSGPLEQLMGEWDVLGRFSLDGLLARFSFTAHGVRPLLHSQIGSLWTAFESLAVDLWVAALNQCPVTLATKAHAAQRRRGGLADRPAQDDEDEEDTDPKAISFDTLHQHGFDLSDKMGTIIYDSRKFNMNRLSGIQHAFAVCFADTKEIFKSHPDLRHLEAYRNVIVHRGGVVDAAFRDRVKSDTFLSKLPDGSLIPVSGPLVARYATAVLSCANKLIEAVAAHLVNNKN